MDTWSVQIKWGFARPVLAHLVDTALQRPLLQDSTISAISSGSIMLWRESGAPLHKVGVDADGGR
jgi:hypothetical protein